MRRLLRWWSRKLRIKPIYHKDGLYLKRYYIGTFFNYWRIYLHHFLLDDPDGLHNHPWKYGISVILVGSYEEERRWGRRVVRWFSVVNGDTLHRVVLPNMPIGHYVSYDDWSVEKQTCWSLFIHSPRVADWAFVRKSPTRVIEPAVYFYDKVYEEPPTPLSDWYKDAPTGAEWETQQERQRQRQKNLLKYNIAVTDDELPL